MVRFRSRSSGLIDGPIDPDGSSTRVCGGAVLGKLMKHSSSNFSTEAKRQTGETMGDHGKPRGRNKRFSKPLGSRRGRHGPMLLQETDSSSEASSGEQKTPAEFAMIEEMMSMKDGGIIQFNPNELLLSSNEDSIEISHSPSAQQTSSAPPVTSTPKNPNISWSSALPSVAEEAVGEDDRNDENRTIGTEPAERQKVLGAMRQLVMKQQSALKEISEQNYQFRRQIDEQNVTIARLRKEREEQNGIVKNLESEKKVMEAEAVWLREELKTIKLEVASSEREHHDLSHRDSLSEAMADTPRMGVKFDTRQPSQGSSTESSSYISPSMRGYGSNLRDPQYTKREEVDAIPTKEEVLLFRNRLEAIQRRRKNRSAPVVNGRVHFGEN